MITSDIILMFTFIFQPIEVPRFERVPDTFNIIVKYYQVEIDTGPSISTRWPNADEINEYRVDIESLENADTLWKKATYYLRVILKEHLIPINVEEWYCALKQWPDRRDRPKSADDVIIARWKVDETIVQMIEYGMLMEFMVVPPDTSEIAIDLKSYLKECLIEYFNFPEEKLQNVKWIDTLPIYEFDKDTVIIVMNEGEWHGNRVSYGRIIYKRIALRVALKADMITPNWWHDIYFWTDGRVFWASFREVDGSPISWTKYFSRTGKIPRRFFSKTDSSSINKGEIKEEEKKKQ